MAIFYLVAAASLLKNYHKSFRGTNLVLLITWAVDSVVSIVFTYFDQRGTSHLWLFMIHILLWHIGVHIIFFVVVLSLKFILIRMEGKDKTTEEV